MPIQGSAFRLPSGAQAARADCIGRISEEDAASWMQQAGPGGRFDGLPVLAVTLQIDSIAHGTPGAFSRRGDTAAPRVDRWMAVVVTNPVIRVTTNFVVRMTGTKTLRLFETVEEAVLWLDERVREDAAGKAAP